MANIRQLPDTQGLSITAAMLSNLGVGVRSDVNLDVPCPISRGQMILDGSTMLIVLRIAVGLITLSFTSWIP